MSAVLESPSTDLFTEEDLDEYLVKRFREAEGSDQPITGSMPFDPLDFDTWIVARLYRRFGVRVFVFAFGLLGACAWGSYGLVAWYFKK